MEQKDINLESRASDKLLLAVSNLTHVNSAYEFIRAIGRFEMEGKCGCFRNEDNRLPKDGKYIRICSIGKTSERIVIDMNTFGVFPTIDHYNTFMYAGKPTFGKHLLSLPNGL